MEKCSMCVQRIQDGKLEAQPPGRPLADGAIQTACQQSCPAQAIIFGDMNDPKSRVHEAMEILVDTACWRSLTFDLPSPTCAS